MNDVKELQLYRDLDNEQIRHQRTLDDKINTTYLNEVPFDPEVVNKNFIDKDFKSEEGKSKWFNNIERMLYESLPNFKKYRIKEPTVNEDMFGYSLFIPQTSQVFFYSRFECGNLR